ERRARAARILPARERIEQLAALLALDDAADIEEVRTLDRVTLPKPLGGAIRGQVDAHADDLVRHALVLEEAVHHRALLERAERDRPRRTEHRLVDRQADRGLVVSGRDQDRALRRER